MERKGSSSVIPQKWLLYLCIYMIYVDAASIKVYAYQQVPASLKLYHFANKLTFNRSSGTISCIVLAQMSTLKMSSLVT